MTWDGVWLKYWVWLPLLTHTPYHWLFPSLTHTHTHTHTQGTMSGGGGRAQRGRMSSKLHDDVTPQQLVVMEKALEAEERAMEVRGVARVDLFLVHPTVG